MAKWEVWKVAVVFGISVVLFGMGLFNTFITPTLLKATIKSVSKFSRPNYSMEVVEWIKFIN